MLPLTSSTVTRSRGAHGASRSPAAAASPSTTPGSFTCTRMAKLSCDESLATAENSTCVLMANVPLDAAACRWSSSPEGSSTSLSSSSNTSGSAGCSGGCTAGTGDGCTPCMGSMRGSGCRGSVGGIVDGCDGRTDGSSRHCALLSGQTRWPCATLAEMRWLPRVTCASSASHAYVDSHVDCLTPSGLFRT